MTCVLSIGEFARASGLTAKALRLYDELELLRPAEVDQSNGYRYVSEAKLGGATWSEISDALGGTNQAARQRRAPNAFERFTT